MEWLNYHHLLYFWTVAKEGKISVACEKLNLSQPTISSQIHTLEDALDVKLFTRVGRNLVLTETGHTVYRYADEIFRIGRELMNSIKGQPTGSPMRFKVGVTDVLPKLVAYRLLEPAIHLPEPIHTTCYEGSADELLVKLSLHELDLVLSDSPINPGLKIRAFNQLLGECGISIFGTAKLAKTYKKGFPYSLHGAPFLFPTENTTLRRSLEQWFDSKHLNLNIVNVFEDSALLKVFGQAGTGIFAMPTVIEKEVKEQYCVKVIGRFRELHEQFYAISLERKIKHPAVEAITKASRDKIFCAV